MASKNAVQSVKERWVSGELLTTQEAVEQLGYSGAEEGKGRGAFLAAVKSHDYLKAGKVEKTSAVPFTLWEKSAIDRYAAERGSHGGSRDGLKWFHIRLDDEAAEMLRGQGYEVVKPTDRGKVAKVESNGVNDNQADQDDAKHPVLADDTISL